MHTLMSNQQYYEALASSTIVNKQGLNSMYSTRTPAHMYQIFHQIQLLNLSFLTCRHLVQSQLHSAQQFSKKTKQVKVSENKAEQSTSLKKKMTSFKKNVEASGLGLESSEMISCWQNVGLFDQR